MGIDYFYPSESYDSMVGSVGTIIKNWDLGYYQGDYIYLLKNSDKIGFTVIGYGSCSGCDALEGCENQEEVDELKESIIKGIFWGTAEEVKSYITSDNANRWYFNDDEWKNIRPEILQAIEKELK